jgi:hypothetical protein
VLFLYTRTWIAGTNRSVVSVTKPNSPSLTLSPKTIRRHVDNLWLLGGEIIRDLNFDPSLSKVAAQQLIRNVVGVDGGPLIYNGSEEERRSLDSTSGKLHRFLSQPPR